MKNYEITFIYFIAVLIILKTKKKPLLLAIFLQFLILSINNKKQLMFLYF